MNDFSSFDTRRLCAERLQHDHLDFIHQMHRDERIMAHLGGLRSPEQTSEYMKHNLAHWERYGQRTGFGPSSGRTGPQSAQHAGHSECHGNKKNRSFLAAAF